MSKGLRESGRLVHQILMNDLRHHPEGVEIGYMAEGTPHPAARRDTTTLGLLPRLSRSRAASTRSFGRGFISELPLAAID